MSDVTCAVLQTPAETHYNLTSYSQLVEQVTPQNSPSRTMDLVQFARGHLQLLRKANK